MLAVLSLSAAMICFAGTCSPVLVGKETPRGTFPLVQRFVQSPGYGGDVLQFHETARDVFAVHRVWLERPSERRAERLASPDAALRRGVTGGCVNVAPAVYEALKGASHIRIQE